jgi:serine/threonine-protein kinase
MKHPSFYATCFWAVVGFLFFLTADFIIMPILAGHLSFTSEVPSVVGKPAKEAQAIFDDENLEVSWDSVGRYSAKVPAGAVLIQVPSPGRRVKEGRTVHLILSKGLREITIPELRGKSQHQAEITLNRLGLLVGKILEGAHVSIPRGVVIRTEPGTGKISRVGDRINIVISAGSVQGRQRLPDLTGTTLERASILLDSLGFKVGTVSRDAVPEKETGIVLKQQPNFGEFLDPGTIVDLTIVD